MAWRAGASEKRRPLMKGLGKRIAARSRSALARRKFWASAWEARNAAAASAREGEVRGLMFLGAFAFIFGGGSSERTNHAPRKPGRAGRRRSLLLRRAAAATGCMVAR